MNKNNMIKICPRCILIVTILEFDLTWRLPGLQQRSYYDFQWTNFQVTFDILIYIQTVLLTEGYGHNSNRLEVSFQQHSFVPFFNKLNLVLRAMGDIGCGGM